jgi:transposase-like protein
MGTSKRFSQEFKQAIVKKLISRGNKTIEQFCNENNVAISTVSKWQSECDEIKNEKKKIKRNLKFQLIYFILFFVIAISNILPRLL